MDSTKALVTYQPQHEYTVLSQPLNTAEIQETFAGLDVQVHCLNTPSLPGKLMRFVRRQLPGVRAGQVAQIDALGLDVVSFPRQILHLTDLNTPVTLTLFDIQHEYLPHFFAPDVLAKRTEQYQRGIAHSDMLLVSTDYTRRTIAEKYPQYLHKTRRIYPGMERDTHVAESLLAEVRERYQLPPKFILYPANPWPHKNHARLFAALRRLKDRHEIAIPIVLTGRLETTMPHQLQQIASAADIEEQVIDPGFVPDTHISALFRLARAMVMPSLYEGFGFPAIEAQLFGCPVACSDGTTFPEITGDGALLFDPYNKDAIADAIWQLWTDDSLCQRLIAAGHENTTRFRWQTYASETIAAFHDLTQKKSP